jgi:hypothetical protein
VYEMVIGYTSNVLMGGWWSTFNGMLLFTTKRMVAAKAHGLWGADRLWRGYLETGLQVDVEELLFKHDDNFAVPYEEMIELRVTKPGLFHMGKVSVQTARGEKVMRIDHRHLYRDDWTFLNSPPPELADKLIVRLWAWL